MKYILSIFTAFVIAFVPTAQAMPGQEDEIFPDVDSTNPYLTDINFLGNKGIANGDEAGLFNPDRPLSRCELLKVSLIAKGITVPEVAAAGFPDLQIEFWCNKYAIYAKGLGIINGYSDGTFKGNNFVTEIEAMKILLNSLGVTLPVPTVDLYTNVKVGEWWTPYIQYIKEKKIEHMVNTPDYPLQDFFLRKKMARILYRGITMKDLNMNEWSDTLPQPPVLGQVEYSDSKFKVTYDSSKWSKLDGGTYFEYKASYSKLKISTPELSCTDLETCINAWNDSPKPSRSEDLVYQNGSFKGILTYEMGGRDFYGNVYKAILFFDNNTFFVIEYTGFLYPIPDYEAFRVEAEALTATIQYVSSL